MSFRNHRVDVAGRTSGYRLCTGLDATAQTILAPQRKGNVTQDQKKKTMLGPRTKYQVQEILHTCCRVRSEDSLHEAMHESVWLMRTHLLSEALPG